MLEPEATAVDDPLLDDPDVAPVGESTGDVQPAGRPSLPGRIGRRIIRRPSRWLNSPWPTERIVQYLTALILVGGATFAVLQVVHLDLVFTNNTPTGGDMGAHVMGAGVPARRPAAALASSAAGACTGTPASRCTASTWWSRR